MNATKTTFSETCEMNYSLRIATIVIVATAVFHSGNATAGDSPIYSVDSMMNHPYMFTPAWGHASQNPGSPKWFAPGYGYQIPGFGYSQYRYDRLNSYNAHYAFGVLQRSSFSSVGTRYRPSVGSPSWYFPGSPLSTDSTSFAW